MMEKRLSGTTICSQVWLFHLRNWPSISYRFLLNLDEDNATNIEIQMVKDSQVMHTFYANVSADLIVQTEVQEVNVGS